MNKKPRLMTLNDQKREQNRSLDRGKKFIGSCFIALAVSLGSGPRQPSPQHGASTLGLGAAVLSPWGPPDACPHLGPPLPPALSLATRVRGTLVSRPGPEVGAVV